MEELKNIILEFLNDKNSPVELAEICKAFSNNPRRQIAYALQLLAADDMAFRSIKEGRAYYSANPDDGEGKLPEGRGNFDDEEDSFTIEDLFRLMSEDDDEDEAEELTSVNIDDVSPIAGEEVVVGRCFALKVPSELIYSTTEGEIADNRVFTAIMEGDHDDLDEELDFDLISPFTAPRSITITKPVTGGGIDVANVEIRQAVIAEISEFPGFTERKEVILENDELVVLYGGMEADYTSRFIIISKAGIFIGQYFVNDENIDREEAEKEIIGFIKTIRACKPGDYEIKPAPDFVPLTYNAGKTIKLGEFTFAVPDNMTIESYDGGTSIYNSDFTGPVSKALDARVLLRVCEMSIHYTSDFSDMTLNNLLDSAMQNVAYEDNSWRKKIIPTEGCGIGVVLSGKSADTIEYWETYQGIIYAWGLCCSINVTFNCKPDETATTQAVSDWFDRIKIGPREAIEAYIENDRQEKLAEYLGPDGRIDGITITKLFTEDVFFCNEEDIESDGIHQKVKKLQINSNEMDSHKVIVQNASKFTEEILAFSEYLEKNELLMIPEGLYHKNLKKASLGHPISGIALLTFCAFHIINIEKRGSNTYAAMIDSKLMSHIPEGFKYLCEFIKTCREFNGINEAFDVTFAGMFSYDSPLEELRRPVYGAVPMDIITVSVGKDEHPYEGVIDRVKELHSGKSDAEMIKNLEKQFTRIVVDTLKEEAGNIYSDMNEFAAEIESNDFSKMNLFDEEAVINKLENMNRSFCSWDGLELRYSTSKIYSDNIWKTPEYRLEFDTVETERFDANAIPRRVASKIKSVKEEDIYLELLEEGAFIQQEAGGEKLLSKYSAAYVMQELHMYEGANRFELDKTQYEGRNARIEKIRVGDRLNIVLSEYEGYSVLEAVNTSGSIGYVNCYYLLEAMKRDTVEATAVVREVTPLSQRSSRAKKGIVIVELEVEEKIPIDPELLAKQKEEARLKAEKEKREAEERRKAEEVRKEKERIRNEISNAEKEIKRLKTEEKNCTARIKDKEDEITSFNKELDVIREEEKKCADVKEMNEYLDKVREIHDLYSKGKVMSTKVTELVNERALFASELSDKKNRKMHPEILSRICAKEVEIDALQDDLRMLLNEVKVKKMNLDSMDSERITRANNLDVKKAEVNKKLDMVTADLEKSKNELNRIERDIANYEAKLEDLKKKGEQ